MNATMEAMLLQERIQLQEAHLRQIRSESEFYIKQVADLERNLITVRDTSKQSNNKVAKVNVQDLIFKQKSLEDEYEHEIAARDVFANKMKTIQLDIDNLEDSLKPVLLKKLKVLEQELIQVKGEKDILTKQIDVLNNQHNSEIEGCNKQLERVNLKVASLKQKNKTFERRLAKLTHRDYSITMDEHIEKIRRAIEEFLGTLEQNTAEQPSTDNVDLSNKRWARNLTDAQMQLIQKLLAGKAGEVSSLFSILF